MTEVASWSWGRCPNGKLLFLSPDDLGWQRAQRPRSLGIWLCWALRNISARRVLQRSDSASTVCKQCFSSSRPRGSRPGLTSSWARCCTATQRTASWPRVTWRKRWAALMISTRNTTTTVLWSLHHPGSTVLSLMICFLFFSSLVVHITADILFHVQY